MSKWKEKTTNQLLLDIQQMKVKHESVKQQMLTLLDDMEDIEKEFKEAQEEINERLKVK